MKRFNQNRFIGSIYCSDLNEANMFRFIQKIYSQKQMDGFIAQIYPNLPTYSSLRVCLPNRANRCAGAQRANQACKSVAVSRRAVWQRGGVAAWRRGGVAAWRRRGGVSTWSTRACACQPASLPACQPASLPLACWPAPFPCLPCREGKPWRHEMNKSEQ